MKNKLIILGLWFLFIIISLSITVNAQGELPPLNVEPNIQDIIRNPDPINFSGRVLIWFDTSSDESIFIKELTVRFENNILWSADISKNIEGIEGFPKKYDKTIFENILFEKIWIDPNQLSRDLSLKEEEKELKISVTFDYNGLTYQKEVVHTINFLEPFPEPSLSPIYKENIETESPLSPSLVTPPTYWYRGDLHLHSDYSSISEGCIKELEFVWGYNISELKTFAYNLGAKWFSVTDHSYCLDATEFSDIQSQASSLTDSNFIVLGSEELSVEDIPDDGSDDEVFCNVIVNDDVAHLGAHFTSTFLSNGLCNQDYDAQQGINNVANEGGFSIINHPAGGDVFSQIAWDWEANQNTNGETGIEIYNTCEYDSDDSLARSFWISRLQRGDHTFAYAGSDRHGGLDAIHGPQPGFGCGNNIAFLGSGGFSQVGLVNALQFGRNTVSDWPFVEISGSSSMESGIMGDTISVYSGNSFDISVPYDLGSKTGDIRIYRGLLPNGGEAYWLYSSRTGTGSITLTEYPTTNRYYRVEIITTDGYRAFSNPIWVNIEADITPPNPPALLTPNGTIGDSTPPFTWSAATDPGGSGIDYYQIQVDNDIGFGSRAIDTTTNSTSYTDPSPLGDDDYYWHVRARDKAGNWGNYSSPLSFTVDTSTPLPDLTLASSDIAWVSVSSQITATIHNTGNASASSVLVEFFNGDPANNDMIGSQTITNITAGGSQNAVVTWNNAPAGNQTVYAVIDSAHLGIGAILESDETNNIASTSVSVPEKPTEVTAIILYPAQPDNLTTTTITGRITNSNGTIDNAQLKFLWAGPDREFGLILRNFTFSISSNETNIEKSFNRTFSVNGQQFIRSELWDLDRGVLVSALEKEIYVFDRTYELRVFDLSTVVPSSANAHILFWHKAGESNPIAGVRYLLFGKLEQYSGDPPGEGQSVVDDLGNWKYLRDKVFTDNEITLSRTLFDNKPDGYYVFSIFEDYDNNEKFNPPTDRDGFSTTSGEVVSYLVNFHSLNPAITNPPNISEVREVFTVNASSTYNGVEDEDITKIVFQKYEGGSWTDVYTDNTPEDGFSYTEDVTNVPDMTEKIIRSQAFAMDGSNASSPSITLIARSDIKPDLTVYPSSISFSPPNPSEGEEVTIYGQVFNIGIATAYDTKVSFYHGDPDNGGTQIGLEQTIASIGVGGNGISSVNWTSIGGSQSIFVVADPPNQIPEINESNNNASKNIEVNVPPTTPTSLTPTSGIYGGGSPINIACSGSTDSNGDPIYYNILGHYDSSWSDLELNGDGIYSWDVSSIASQTGVSLKCNATDLTDSSEYFIPAGTLEIDTTPPSGNITINDGDIYTNSNTSTLTLFCSDANGCSQMQFSNDGANYSTPEAYSTAKTWTLTPGDGTKTVYVEYKDSAGNWMATPANDTIVLETTHPTVENSSTYDILEGQNETVRVDVWDALGIDTVLLELDGAANYTMENESGNTYNFTIIGPPLGTHLIRYFVNDTAGNVNGTEVDSFSVSEYTFPLHMFSGMNLVSLPIVPRDPSFGSVFNQSCTGYNITSVYRRSNQNGEYTAIDYYPNLNCSDGLWYDPTIFPAEPAFEAGTGYWLSADEEFDLNVSGIVPSANQSFTLYSGISLVGWSSINTVNFSDAIVQNCTDYNVTDIRRRNNQDGTYTKIVYYSNQSCPDGMWYDPTTYPAEPVFEPGQAYFFNSTKDWVWRYEP